MPAVLGTLGLILVAQATSYVLIPGLNRRHCAHLLEIMDRSARGPSLLGVSLPVVSFSIGTLGLMPYCAAAVWLQLFGFARAHMSGRRQHALPQAGSHFWVMSLTLVFCLLQACFLARWMERVGTMHGAVVTSPGPSFRVVANLSMTAGTFLLVWIATRITRLGVCNGFLAILSIGAISDLRRTLAWAWSEGPVVGYEKTAIACLSYVAAFLAAFLFLRATRLLRVRNGRRGGHTDLGLAIGLGSTGGAPLILTGWAVLAAATAMQSGGLSRWAMQWSPGVSETQTLVAAAVTVPVAWLTVWASTTATRASDDLLAAGLYLPGVRPGSPTADHLKRVMLRMSLPAGVLLGLVCVLPLLWGFLGAETRRVGPPVSGAWVLLLAAFLVDARGRWRSWGVAPPSVPSPPAAMSAPVPATCPACGLDVEPGFVVCWSCEAALVPLTPSSSAPPTVDPEEAWREVSRHNTAIDAQVAQLRLTAEGVPSRLCDLNLVHANWFLSWAVGGIRVEVPASRSERAGAVLGDLVAPVSPAAAAK